MLRLNKFLNRFSHPGQTLLILFCLFAVPLLCAAENKMISELLELTLPAETDTLYIIDDVISKKISVLNFYRGLESALTAFEIHIDNLPAELLTESEGNAAYEPLDTAIVKSDEAEVISANWDFTANPHAVNEGGTGAATFTDGGILLGSGTSAITALGAATNGQIPIGDGTTDPVLANITETGDALVVTNGAGTIALSAHANVEQLADGEFKENIINVDFPWADNEVVDGLSLAALNLNKLTVAPGTPVAGEVYYADQTTWDPSGLGAVGAYYCIYDGANYIAMFDEDGTWYVSNIMLPSYSHFATGDAVYSDTSTPHVLTAAETKNAVITNAGAAEDKVYTLPPAEFGMNFMVMVIVGYQMDLEPDGTETLWLNGTQMAAGEHIQNTADTKSDVMSCWSVESGDGTYEVFCKSDNANFVEATP